MISCTHRRRRTWTDKDLVDAVRLSRSYSEVITKLGLNQGGGTHQHIKLHMGRLGIQFLHRDSHAWMRDPGANTGGRPMPLDQILVSGSSYSSNGRYARTIDPSRTEKGVLRNVRIDGMARPADSVGTGSSTEIAQTTHYRIFVCSVRIATHKLKRGANRSRRSPMAEAQRLGRCK